MATLARSALITGAAKRVGAEIARTLAAAGFRVVVHYNRSGAEARALAAEIAASGGVCHLLRADLADRAEVDAMIDRCIAAFGPLDALINNASHFSNDTISTVTWSGLDAHWVPNLGAPMMLSRDFARALEGERTGCIVNLLDQKVGNLNPDFISYTISKVALAGLTQVLAMAFAPRIRVCGVSPGLTLISGKQTQQGFEQAWAATPLGRSSTPQEIAQAVLFILNTPSMTGQTITIDGGESLAGRPRDVAFDPDLA
jgi:NAD(P)-dependent dehydrogenase (short-subunit alcohol dehydrogenase family)